MVNAPCWPHGVEKYMVFSYEWSIANDLTDDNHIEQAEIDKWWDFGIALGVLDGTDIKNKSMVIPLNDLDRDGLLNLDEAMVVAHKTLGISEAKSLQIDCKFCVDDT